MYNATCNYFEGPEHKRNVLNCWNKTTLRTIISKNPEKSTLEYLQLLINNLRHLQHSLKNNLKIDDFLHNKIITTCITHEAYRYAYYKPVKTVTGLINELQTSINVYEASRLQESQAFHTCLQDPKDPEPEVYFTDRQYYRQPQPTRTRQYT